MPNYALVRYMVKPRRLIAALPALSLFCGFASGLGLAAPRTAAESSRIVQSLNEGWRLQLGAETNAIAPDYDDSVWRVADVPSPGSLWLRFGENPASHRFLKFINPYDE